jgi:hypothetical protein
MKIILSAVLCGCRMWSLTLKEKYRIQVSENEKFEYIFGTKYSKSKINLSLCLTEHHIMKTYWGGEVYLHAFLVLGRKEAPIPIG